MIDLPAVNYQKREKCRLWLDFKCVSTHSKLKCSHFTMNVVITSLESMYNYSNVTLISRNLWKSLLCPCVLHGLNKNMSRKSSPKSAKPRAFPRFAQWLIRPWAYVHITVAVGPLWNQANLQITVALGRPFESVVSLLTHCICYCGPLKA